VKNTDFRTVALFPLSIHDDGLRQESDGAEIERNRLRQSGCHPALLLP